MYDTNNHNFRCSHHCHIFLVMAFSLGYLMPPILLIHETAVVLSIRSSISQSRLFAAKHVKPKYAALSSKKFICWARSASSQTPYVSSPSHAAPQPVVEASEKISNENLCCFIGFEEFLTFSIHQSRSASKEAGIFILLSYSPLLLNNAKYFSLSNFFVYNHPY